MSDADVPTPDPSDADTAAGPAAAGPDPAGDARRRRRRGIAAVVAGMVVLVGSLTGATLLAAGDRDHRRGDGPDDRWGQQMPGRGGPGMGPGGWSGPSGRPEAPNGDRGDDGPGPGNGSGSGNSPRG